MTTNQTTYFAFPYTADKYVLGLFYDQWIGFYNYYFELPFSYSTNKAILNKNQPYINLLKEKAEKHG